MHVDRSGLFIFIFNMSILYQKPLVVPPFKIKPKEILKGMADRSKKIIEHGKGH